MDRSREMSRIAATACLLGALCLAASGCSLVPLAAYMIKGVSQPADFDRLKGQKIAVICRPAASLQYQSSSISRELAGQIGDLIAEHVVKVKVIDQDEIEKWEDENNWDDYAEIGKALQADMVVGIDLEDFNLQQGPTLYQGRSTIELAVYEINGRKKPIYQKTLPQRLFPPNAPISATDKSLAEFRQQYVRVLAEQVARHFYEHDSTSDFAMDSAAHH